MAAVVVLEIKALSEAAMKPKAIITKAVRNHRLRQHESPYEQEDHGVSERAEDHVARRVFGVRPDARHVEHHAKGQRQ